MFRPVLITPPVGTPVTLDECKEYVVVDHAEDDSLITDMIKTATDHLDGFDGVLGRAIMEQTWQVQMDRWGRRVVLPVPQVSSVTISYVDAAGTSQSWPGTQWVMPIPLGTDVRLIGDFPTVPPDHPAPIAVQFTAGWATSNDVPWAIKGAIMQMVGQMYDNRGGEPEIGPMLNALIAPYRWVSV